MSLLNPWVILGAVLAAIAVYAAGDYRGHARGVNQQKAEDQIIFDNINAKIARQKAEAAAAYRQAQDDVIALQVERDQLKNDLGKRREDDRKATDATRAKFAGVGLRIPAPKSSGVGADSCGPKAAGGDAAKPDAPATIELPAAVTRDLRQLTLEADTLADEYRKCYGYATQVK